MTEFKFANKSTKERIKEIVVTAMNIYMSRLISGWYEPGLEATFQHNLSLILNELLALNTNCIGESFSLMLEKTFR